MLDNLRSVDPDIFAAVAAETWRQNDGLELIASENFPSEAVFEAMASVFNNKYAEGYPGRRYYGGCAHADRVERLAIERARALFHTEHANVQPHAGSQANMAVFFTAMNPGDRFLGMSLAHGGHLTHGHPLSFSGRFFAASSYGLVRDTERIDYDELEKTAAATRPKLIVVGASAYSRIIDFARVRQVADSVGALVMADIAHIAGPIAAGLHPSPVPHAHFVTTTTHKTLRGPRGGIVMCAERFAKDLDRTVFPGLQGGPLVHVIAAKAVALKEAASEEFRTYQRSVLANAAHLAAALIARGHRIVSGGTDNHLFLLDLTSTGLTGKEAEDALGRVRITVNKNAIPFDPRPPMVASGIRIGTPAVTSRGMALAEMEVIAEIIDRALSAPGDHPELLARVGDLAGAFPLYPRRLEDLRAAGAPRTEE
jgi:glycine hydroxymethyltransferase